MEQVVKSMIETYFKQNGMDNTICQHPAFDLLEIIYQKLLQETNGVQEEVFDQLEQYCDKHIKIENNTIIYQATIPNFTAQENCMVVEAYFYELFSDNRLSKMRITASTDGMESETNSLFEEVYDSTNCFFYRI